MRSWIKWTRWEITTLIHVSGIIEHQGKRIYLSARTFQSQRSLIRWLILTGSQCILRAILLCIFKILRVLNSGKGKGIWRKKKIYMEIRWQTRRRNLGMRKCGRLARTQKEKCNVLTALESWSCILGIKSEGIQFLSQLKNGCAQKIWKTKQKKTYMMQWCSDPCMAMILKGDFCEGKQPAQAVQFNDLGI